MTLKYIKKYFLLLALLLSLKFLSAFFENWRLAEINIFTIVQDSVWGFRFLAIVLLNNVVFAILLLYSKLRRSLLKVKLYVKFVWIGSVVLVIGLNSRGIWGISIAELQKKYDNDFIVFNANTSSKQYNLAANFVYSDWKAIHIDSHGQWVFNSDLYIDSDTTAIMISRAQFIWDRSILLRLFDVNFTDEVKIDHFRIDGDKFIRGYNTEYPDTVNTALENNKLVYKMKLY